MDILKFSVPEMILSITTQSPYDWTTLAFHWVKSSSDANSQLCVPSAIGSAGPFFGVRYRSFDYGDLLQGSLEDIYLLPILNGTKIGGIPYSAVNGLTSSGQFMCQLGSIQAHPGVPYPWTNREAPLSDTPDDEHCEETIYDEDNNIVFYDMESLCFFLENDGVVSCV